MTKNYNLSLNNIKKLNVNREYYLPLDNFFLLFVFLYFVTFLCFACLNTQKKFKSGFNSKGLNNKH